MTQQVWQKQKHTKSQKVYFPLTQWKKMNMHVKHKNKYTINYVIYFCILFLHDYILYK